MKLHLLKDDNQSTLCGLKRGQWTTNPDFANCKWCKRSFKAIREYPTYRIPDNIVLGEE